MSANDGINLNWVQIDTDGDFVISVNAQGNEGLCREIEGAVYFDGTTPTGQLTFGIRGQSGTFVPFADGLFNTDKLLKHGKNITLMVRAAGIVAQVFQIAYAGNVS